jgi:hypothetical protein
MRKRTTSVLGGAACALAIGVSTLASVPASAQTDHKAPGDGLRTVTGGLAGPRGVASVRPGVTLVSTADGTVSVVRERRGPARVQKLFRVPSQFALGIAFGPHWTVYAVTGAATSPDPADPKPPKPVAAVENSLFKWRPHWAKPHRIADIGAYQKHDLDPYDLEKNPSDSNPFGVAALPNGSVLVADAAGNDLLKVRPNGAISTVARLKPRVVTVPEGLGKDAPPAGTQIPAEAVATSVTVGSDGYYYVGELRGFPATPGTSEIWRINPYARGAVCDPAQPTLPGCRRYADGLTSIVDLASASHGTIYAVTLSKKSWLAAESQPPVPGAEVGGLFKVGPWGTSVTELAADQLKFPGGADIARNGRVYVTGPVFGRGSLVSLVG